MSTEKLNVIQAALKLQGDLAVLFREKGMGQASTRMAEHVMDTVLMSDAVKPEIKEIYKEIADGIGQG